MSTALRTYYRGDELVGLRDGQANATRYYHFDHQGTTQCLTDKAATVTDRSASDAWGVQVKRTGSSINRHWYVGNLGYYKSQAVIYYIRARYLDCRMGRWLSIDPTDTLDGVYNRFQYAYNTPDIYTDPSGLTVAPPPPPPTFPPVSPPPTPNPPLPPQPNVCEPGSTEVFVRGPNDFFIFFKGCCRIVRNIPPGGTFLCLAAGAVLLSAAPAGCKEDEESCAKKYPNLPHVRPYPNDGSSAAALVIQSAKAQGKCQYSTNTNRGQLNNPLCPGPLGPQPDGEHRDICCAKSKNQRWTPPSQGYQCPRGWDDVGTVVCCAWCEEPGTRHSPPTSCRVHRVGNTTYPW